mgnify:CR=1 FL=1
MASPFVGHTTIQSCRFSFFIKGKKLQPHKLSTEKKKEQPPLFTGLEEKRRERERERERERKEARERETLRS